MTEPALEIATGSSRVIARREGALGWVIFDNPARRNALSIDMWLAIPKAMEAFGDDPAVRVVILAGAGDKAFISGADISQFEDSRANPQDERRYSAATAAGFAAIAGLEKPTIAMIRGFCVGGGLGVALTCDLRIAAQDARFAIPAAKLGLAYDISGAARLADVVGPARAKDILYTARMIEAGEALAMGLVNTVVPIAELESAARACAGQIAANAPLSVLASKLAVEYAMADETRRDAGRVEQAAERCFASADYAEGRRAFMEKRPPRFEGR